MGPRAGLDDLFEVAGTLLPLSEIEPLVLDFCPVAWSLCLLSYGARVDTFHELVPILGVR